MVKKNSRDLIGYGSREKKISWPNNAKLALQIVLNYEEGGENSILNGDKYSETFLSEIIGAKAIKGRHISMESIYEYGSRAGFWRLNKLFKEKKIPVTIFGVGLALKQNPEVCNAIKNGDYEIAAHGYRWIDYQDVKKSVEKKHMQLAIKTIKDIFGSRPLGWYTGRCSPNTSQCPRRHLRRKRLYETRHRRLYHAKYNSRSVFCFCDYACTYSFGRL